MEYDLTVIGAGWAGFNAALKARELGLKVALIEKSAIGGTCLNQGCIPTKTLIQSAKIYSLNKKSAVFGIENVNPQINFLKIQERKDKIIQQLQQGMQFRLKGIDFYDAPAQILLSNEIKIDSQTIKTKFILIATGSQPSELKTLRFDGKKIISSSDILNLKELPRSLLIIGGGVIGCEFASLFAIFGTQVTIVEKMPQILPGEDKEIAKKLESTFKKKGIKVNTGVDAATLDLTAYDLALLCIGRSASTSGLGLEKAGVKLDREAVVVDEYLRTNIPNIYAAGDCTAKIMLAHFAAYQGRIAAENIASPSNSAKAENKNIPNCIFTDPQIASIGMREEEAESQGLGVKINKFDFMASGMARIMDEAEGFIKIISDKKTSQILGASVIGPQATELIAVLAVAISNQLKASALEETIFAHPSLSESISEALKKDYAI